MPSARQLATDTAAFVRTPRARKILWWVVGLVALIAVVGFFLVPAIAKGKLEEILSERLHRKVTIERVRANPFALSITVQGFLMRERASDEPAVSFDELYVNASSASLVRLAPVLDQVRLVKPHVRVIRNADKTYNYQDLVDEILAKPKSDDPPPKFSLNNIELVDGRIDFDDRPEKNRHEVSDIRIGIPFISNLPHAVDVQVQPALFARVNGAPVEVKGETKPFADTRETRLALDVDDLQLPKYIDYSPVPLKFKLPSGRLDTKLTLIFTTLQERPQTLTLAGELALTKLVVQEAGGAPLLDLPSLKVAIGLFDAINSRLEVKSVAIDGVAAQLKRLKDGSLNMLSVLPAPPPADKPAAPAAAPKPFVFSVAEIHLANGRLQVADEVPASPYRVGLENISLDVQGLSNAPGTKAGVKLTFATDAKGGFAYEGGVQLQPLAVDGRFGLVGFRLGALYPYYESALNLEVADGTLDLAAQFAVAQKGAEFDLALSALNAAINKLVLRFPGEKEPLATFPLLSVKGGEADLGKRVVTLGEVGGRDGTIWVRRDTDGKLLFARLVKTQADVAAAPKGDESQPWTYGYGQLALDNFTIHYEDRVPATPVKVEVTRVGVRIEKFANAKGARAQAAIRGIVNKAGTFVVAGPLGVNPVGGNLRVDAKNVALVPFQPFLDEKLNLAITSGAVSTRGQLVFDLPPGASPKIAYAGELNVTDFASIDKPTSSDLLKWKSLFIGGIKTQLEPLQVAVSEVALSDFYSRLIVNADGTLNLQRLTKQADEPKPAEAEADEAKTGEATPASPKPAAPPPEPAPSGKPALPPNISIGQITLQGGNVNFSDFFIKPNYSANLTGIGGSVTTITPEQAGDVELRGKVDNTAPLEIIGRVNPLAKDLFLDIKASAKDIELPPLTPYSVKYAGYGIEKGKLSVSVKYFIENRKLAAENNVYLDQLTFGEKVDSPTATKLPVLLVVALLKDRNGVIDINLPVSGSLDDPQFSIGGIIVRVIVNLLVKVVTSPFALLGAALGGGGEELAYLEFAPGVARLVPEAEGKLKTVATALNDRPALKMDIAGRIDPDTDREGLKRASIDHQVKAQKLKETLKGGESAGSVDEVTIEQAEYAKYLTAAYKDAKFPKPRNVIGMAKDLPVPEMEQLMLTNAQAGDEEMRQLANQRAQVAKDWLVETGKVPAERVFLIAPKLNTEGVKDKGKPSRADFSLK